VAGIWSRESGVLADNSYYEPGRAGFRTVRRSRICPRRAAPICYAGRSTIPDRARVVAIAAGLPSALGVTRNRVTSLALAALLPALACARTATVGSPATTANASTTAATGEVATIGPNGPPIGVQLWTVREMAKTDPKAMLATVRGWGISHVETHHDESLHLARARSAAPRARLRPHRHRRIARGDRERVHRRGG
jgi:hypothetical protein